MADRTPVITGIGVVSCLGVGAEAHWQALNAGIAPPVDRTLYAPFAVHPVGALAWEAQIPRKADLRQMELWQRLGTYAAGLALDHAGAKGDPALLEAMDLIVAASGGERDIAVDEAIFPGLAEAADRGAFLNQRLGADLRPTSFLAQLSNLLAGNIAIVHGVVGASRTLIGDEAAGADALRIASARIRAGQSAITLAGAAFNAQRPETLLTLALGGVLATGPTFDNGMVPGSGAAFLVLESADHAKARGAKPLARLDAILTDRCGRTTAADTATAVARKQFAALAPQLDRNRAAVLSTACALRPISDEEQAFLTDDIGLPCRHMARHTGHLMEAALPMAAALAALALSRQAFYPPASAAETTLATPPHHLLLTTWGHWRGEAMALLSATV